MKRPVFISVCLLLSALLLPFQSSVYAEMSADDIKAALSEKAASKPDAADGNAAAGNIAGEEAATETEFVAPDTYPSIYATPYASETDGGLAYLPSDDGESVTIVGYRGDSSDVEIPATIGGLSVTRIEAAAFLGDDTVKRLTVPASVTDVGEEAFSQMTRLTSVSLPDSLKVIPDRLFASSEELREVNLPASLQSIGAEAFAYCRLLGALTVPSGVTEIGVDAFFGCESLTLDSSDSPAAKAYAEANGLSTGFESTLLIVVVAASIAAAAALLAILRISRAKSAIRDKNAK